MTMPLMQRRAPRSRNIRFWCSAVRMSATTASLLFRAASVRRKSPRSARSAPARISSSSPPSADDGKVVPADHRYAMRNKANQLWHTDSSFKSVPALTSILSARIIPANGGETEFVSTRLAFERLDRGDAARSSKTPSPGIITAIRAARSRPASPPATSSRRCRRNAGAWCGKIRSMAASALYLASHAYAVEGMEPTAGEKLIEELTASRHRAGHQL